MVKIDKFMHFFIFFAMTHAGCSSTDGRGEVRGEFVIPSCHLEVEDYSLGINFYTAAYFDNTLTIRLQHKGVQQKFADGVFLEVRDVTSLANSLGRALDIDLEPPLEEFEANGPGTGVGASSGVPLTTYDSPVRATLYLNETCPGNRLGFTDGAGSVVFENIYRPDKSKRIRGAFDLAFIDARTWESPEEPGERAAITGEFDFEFSRGKPGQTFF
jgi:hypothetical protein